MSTKVTPFSDVEKGEAGKSDDQAIFQTSFTKKDKDLKDIDEAVASACQSPGIFLIIWAGRGGCVFEEYIVMVISIIIQIVVPAYIVGRNPDPFEGYNDETAFGVKLTAFALSLYLVSTFADTMNRINAYSALVSTIPGFRWILALAITNLYCSILLTALSTFILFRQDPDIKDILLNCIALNFLPEVDQQIVSLLKVSMISSFGVTVDRLNKFAETWSETSARNLLQTAAEIPSNAAFCKQFPLIFSVAIANKFLVFSLLAWSILIGIVV